MKLVLKMTETLLILMSDNTLRDLGFQEGEYDVVYKFLRRLSR